MSPFAHGEGGIRTLGPLPTAGFQDRCNRPTLPPLQFSLPSLRSLDETLQLMLVFFSQPFRALYLHRCLFLIVGARLFPTQSRFPLDEPDGIFLIGSQDMLCQILPRPVRHCCNFCTFSRYVIDSGPRQLKIHGSHLFLQNSYWLNGGRRIRTAVIGL